MIYSIVTFLIGLYMGWGIGVAIDANYYSKLADKDGLRWWEWVMIISLWPKVRRPF